MDTDQKVYESISLGQQVDDKEIKINPEDGHFSFDIRKNKNQTLKNYLTTNLTQRNRTISPQK